MSSIISDNKAKNGGAIVNWFNELKINDSTIDKLIYYYQVSIM